MEGRVITAKMIAEFKEHLILEERSVATIQKYIRDVKAFTAYAQNSAITKKPSLHIRNICKRTMLCGA